MPAHSWRDSTPTLPRLHASLPISIKMIRGYGAGFSSLPRVLDTMQEISRVRMNYNGQLSLLTQRCGLLPEWRNFILQYRRSEIKLTTLSIRLQNLLSQQVIYRTLR